MLRCRIPVRTCLLSAVLLVAAGCSTSGTNEPSADRPSTTVASVDTTTTTTAASTTTTPPTTTSEPELPREDEWLETFLEDCETGSEEACDYLFLVSDPDTEYEDVANTCGGRGDGLTFCTPGLDLVDGTADSDSAAVQKLVADCQSGASMHACDLLYMVTEADSAEEEIGATCGGRIPEGAEPACTIELGVAVGP